MGLIAGSTAKARSTLGRVLKRLNAAIANLMRLASKSPDPLMDYQSLMSLSSSSRVQTIKAFDQLSRRLGSTGGGSSRGSVVSTATSSGTKSSKATTATKTTSKSSRSKDGKRHSKKSSSDKRTTGSAATAAVTATYDSSIDRRRERERERDSGPPRLQTSIPTPMLDMMVMGGSERRDVSPLRRRASLMSRFSIMSISSASTKLGEIPERRWYRRGSDDVWAGPGGGGGGGGGFRDEYNAPTVYPLKPYQPVVKERKFMGLFRRGQ